MSTGSSDSGTGSTSDQDQPKAFQLAGHGAVQLAGPGAVQLAGPGAECDNQSVYSEANTNITSNSSLYVKMQDPS